MESDAALQAERAERERQSPSGRPGRAGARSCSRAHVSCLSTASVRLEMSWLDVGRLAPGTPLGCKCKCFPPTCFLFNAASISVVKISKKTPIPFKVTSGYPLEGTKTWDLLFLKSWFQKQPAGKLLSEVHSVENMTYIIHFAQRSGELCGSKPCNAGLWICLGAVVSQGQPNPPLLRCCCGPGWLPSALAGESPPPWQALPFAVCRPKSPAGREWHVLLLLC